MRQDYKTEFPDFDFEIPKIPDGFVDDSWHNDICPKFERKYNETHKMVLGVNYLDENRRECGGKQFTVIIMESDDYFYVEPEYEMETDSWDEAINKANELFKEAKQ